MKLPADFLAVPGKTLFMVVANPLAVLVTRSAKRMRQRTMKFPTPHAALDWCLNRRATFVLLPHRADPKLN
jgi:hypothetical protein